MKQKIYTIIILLLVLIIMSAVILVRDQGKWGNSSIRSNSHPTVSGGRVVNIKFMDEISDESRGFLKERGINIRTE